MPYVLGIDAGGTKTTALLADESGDVLAEVTSGGANLRTHGELGVEKVLHSAIEETEGRAGVRAEALALGIAGADRPDDHAVLRAILRRIGFRERVVITNDARIAFIAGSDRRVGLALVCGTGSIAWGRNAAGDVARAGGWGWHVGDEGSGFWIGERALRASLRAFDGRGASTSLEAAVLVHFGLERMEELVRAVYDREYPRHEVALLAIRVAEEAERGDAVAGAILAEAQAELVAAAQSVVRRLGLGGPGPGYDVVLSGGTFRAVTLLRDGVAAALAAPGADVRPLDREPAIGAVRLALEALAERGSVKRLIVNADDYGRTPGINRGTLDAHRNGVVTSATVMILEAAAEEGIRRALTEAPRLALGLHFMLTGGGRPASRTELPTLAPGGVLVRNAEALPADLEPAEVRCELDAQIDRFERIAGRPPSHLDSHHHCALHPSVQPVFAEVAARRGLPVRAASVSALAELRARGVMTPDRFFDSFYDAGATRGNLRRIIEELPEGTSELMCHPGYSDPILAAGSTYSEAREREVAILSDPEIAALLSAQGVGLATFEGLSAR